jgi:DNA polymerase III epsilon subunit-like protein
LDLETGGLDPAETGIVEIGGIFQWPGQERTRRIFERQADPRKGRDGMIDESVEIHPKALEVNHLTMAEIETFQSIDKAVTELDSFVEPWCVIAGWNVANFDIPFLKAAYKRAGLTWRFHYHCLDMMVVANFLKFAGKIDSYSLSLANVCKYLGIDQSQFGPAHRALPDVYATVAVAKEFQDRFFGSRKVRI